MIQHATIERLGDFFHLSSVGQDDGVFSTLLISDNQTWPISLSWTSDEHSPITLTCVLGSLAPYTDYRVPLELMTINLMMASTDGPRFSYSRSSDTLLLIDSLSVTDMQQANSYALREQVENLINKGERTRIMLGNAGYPLLEPSYE
jgi:hypothetical protein